jgi:hypothetical protein
MMRIAVAVAVVAWAGAAGADLYRWVDQESGSVKYSSYPPPWYGDQAKQRRAPKVEVIPAGRDTRAKIDEPAADEAASKPRAVPAGQALSLALEGLSERRKALLAAFESLQNAEDFSRAGEGVRQQYEAYLAVTAEMNRLDPKGAEGRVAASRQVVERIAGGLRAAGAGR